MDSFFLEKSIVGAYVPKIKKILLSISLTERRKRMYRKYIQERLRMEELEELEVHSEYIELKSRLEYRRGVFAFLMIGLIISIFIGIWKQTIDLIQSILRNILGNQLTVEEAGIVVVIILFISMVVGLLLLVSILIYLNETRRLYKKKLLLEEIVRKTEIKK